MYCCTVPFRYRVVFHNAWCGCSNVAADSGRPDAADRLRPESKYVGLDFNSLSRNISLGSVSIAVRG